MLVLGIFSFVTYFDKIQTNFLRLAILCNFSCHRTYLNPNMASNFQHVCKTCMVCVVCNVSAY